MKDLKLRMLKAKACFPKGFKYLNVYQEHWMDYRITQITKCWDLEYMDEVIVQRFEALAEQYKNNG